jgi:hypothetical protein
MWGSVIGDIIASKFKFNDENITNDLFSKENIFTENTVYVSSFSQATAHIQNNTKFLNDLKNKYSDSISKIENKQNIFIEKKYKNTLKENLKKFSFSIYYPDIKDWIENDTPFVDNFAFSSLNQIVLQTQSLEEALFLTNRICHIHNIPLFTANIYVNILSICKIGGGNILDIKAKLIEFLNNQDLQYQPLEYYKKNEVKDINDLLLKCLSCVLSSFSFEESIKNALTLKGDKCLNLNLVGTLAEMMYSIPEDYLYKSVEYFDYNSLPIIKHINKAYLRNNQYGTLATQNLNKNYDFYQYIADLNLKDPTAEWDPLTEVSDDAFYSNYEKKIRHEQKNIFSKIISAIKNLIK